MWRTMKKLSLIIIGGGDRGNSYLKYLELHPEQFVLVAIAEPVKEKRDYLKERYHVSADMCFESWEELLNRPKMADIAIEAKNFERANISLQKVLAILDELTKRRP